VVCLHGCNKIGIVNSRDMLGVKRKPRMNVLLPPFGVGKALRSQLLNAFPKLDSARQEETLSHMEQWKENDPLAVLQEDSLAGGKAGGQFHVMKLAPNFEIAMYLAQATGSCIVTDSPFRWTEVKRTIRQRAGGPYLGLATLARDIEGSDFAFPQNVTDIATFEPR
jgi:hypothetical protein